MIKDYNYYRDKFMIFGKYLEKQQLDLSVHEDIYHISKSARRAGITDSKIDEWIEQGRDLYHA